PKTLPRNSRNKESHSPTRKAQASDRSPEQFPASRRWRARPELLRIASYTLQLAHSARSATVSACYRNRLGSGEPAFSRNDGDRRIVTDSGGAGWRRHWLIAGR